MLRTTAGQVLVNDTLPEDMQDWGRVLDKKGINDLLRQVAQRHPEKYPEISKKLNDVGRTVATEFGGYSFGLEHLATSKIAQQNRIAIRAKLKEILDNDDLTPKQRNDRIVMAVGSGQQKAIDDVFDEAVKANNPLAMQVVSGSRGNKMNMATLLSGDSLYADHHDNVIPLPVLSSYSEGLKPSEYWAATYGARRGTLATKFAVRDAGYLCIARGTLVRMADWTTKAIEAVAVGDVVLGADKTGRTFPVTVTATFDNGVKPLHTFRFRYGKSRTDVVEVTATAEHRALVRYLRRTRERPNPKLVKRVTVGPRPLGACERRAVSFHSLVPPQGFDDSGYGVHEPWAWFVGLLLGDGGLTTNHLGYSCSDPGLLAAVTARLTADGFTIGRKGDAPHEYIISDQGPGVPNRLRTYLRDLELLGLLSPEKFVPTHVDGWDNASVAALIRGVFDTDGGVATANNDSMPFLRLGMTAEAVVRGVQRLLADRFGIYGQVCRGNTIGRPVGIVPGSVANHDIHSLTIADRTSVERFAKHVGFASPGKRDRLHALLAASTTAAREDSFLFHFLDSTFIGSGPTHDIEVDHPDHLFVLANGAIVSNSKQLNQINHRLMVVGDDDPRDLPMRGLPVDTDDPDNEGALLAHDVGPYKRNTVLSPKMLGHLKQLKHDRILVRSPVVGGSPDGGVYARDVGVRERGVLPGRGEMVGLTAAQALSEPLSQGQLSAKHSGGVAGQEKAVGGFKLVDQMVQVPSTFAGGATHSEHDGIVQSIDPAPAGGHHVWVNNEQHYVPRERELKVKRGETVEAGDVLSSGYPNPSKVVEHKGVGEGKRYFVKAFHGAMKDAGMKASRRNIELLARGLINHVRLTDEFADYVPEDVVPYSTMEHLYQPRDDRQTMAPDQHAVGKYLEKPILHYSIGTKIRPSVLSELNHFGVKDIEVHDKPPPFAPHMVRGMYSLQNDPDWMTRMYGSGLKDSVRDGTARGAISDELGTSFVPSLSRAVDFGRIGNMQTPEAGTAPPPEGIPLPPPPAIKPTGMPKMPGMAKMSSLGELLAATARKNAAEYAEYEKLAGIDSTIKPNTGSSTGGMAPVAPIKPAPGAAEKPQAEEPNTPQLKPALPASPLGITPKQPPAPMPGSPEPNAPAPAGQVNPQRAAIMRGASGLLQPHDDPRQVSQFVAGHEDPNQFRQGHGGAFGAATRFGSLFDADAVSTLTGGKPRAGLTGQSGSLLGGAETNTAHTWGPAIPQAVPQPSGVPSTAAAGVSVMASPLGASLAAQLPGWIGRNASKALRASPWVYGAVEAARGLSQSAPKARAQADSIYGAAGTNLRPDGQEPGTFGALKHFAESPGKYVGATGQAISDAEQQARATSDQNIQFHGARAGAGQARLDELKAKAANPATPLTPQEQVQLAMLQSPLQFNTPESFGNSGTTYEHATNALGGVLNTLLGPEDGGGPTLVPTDATRAAAFQRAKEDKVQAIQTEQRTAQTAASLAAAPDPVAAIREHLKPASGVAPVNGVTVSDTQIAAAQRAVQTMPAGPLREQASQMVQAQVAANQRALSEHHTRTEVQGEAKRRASQEFSRLMAARPDKREDREYMAALLQRLEAEATVELQRPRRSLPGVR